MICSKCQFENKETAKFCKNCGNKLDAVKEQLNTTVTEPTKKSNNKYILLGVASIIVVVIVIFMFGKKDVIPPPESNNGNENSLNYNDTIILYNTVESRKDYNIDYDDIDSSEVSFFEKYHVVENIMAPELPNVTYEKQESDSQTIYRKRITDDLSFVTIVYKLDKPITAHSYLMDNDDMIVLEATNYFTLDQNSSEYDLAYSSDETDYNYIYSDSIKKENNSMEYYYLINNGNFTIDYYQKGDFLYSLGFVRDGNVMSKRYQYYNDNKIISFEYENFNDGTNNVNRLDDNGKFRFARNFGNFTLESLENIYYYYDNNSLLSHLYNVNSDLRINYIYDFEVLTVNEIKFTSDWDYKSMKGYGLELKAFNPFYYEKYAELFGIYDVGIYFKSFQFIRYND